MKNLSLFAFFGVILAFTSCRPQVADKIIQSKAESFSPGYVKTGDVVRVLGVNLLGSSVKVGGVSMELEEITEDYLEFIITDKLKTDVNGEDAENNIEITFENGDVHRFSFPLIVNYKITIEDKQSGAWLENSPQDAEEILQGPKQLIIADFDDGGIRNAARTERFDKTQFNPTLKDGTVGFVGTGSGVKSSPAKGDYLGVQTPTEDILQGTFGFAGEVVTRSEVTTKGDLWPDNFADYPNGPLTKPGTPADVSAYYINFCIFTNGNDKTVVYPYLFNDVTALGDRFRNNTFDNAGVIGLEDWQWVSLRLTTFKSNFGNNSSVDPTTFLGINKLNLGLSHFELKDQSETAPLKEIEKGVEVYIDHIVITQGAPFYGNMR